MQRYLWQKSVVVEVDYETFLQQIKRDALRCRAFETLVFEKFSEKKIKIPVYLSAGQELIPSVLSNYLSMVGYGEVSSRQIFIQHRGHSTYLSFGGEIRELIFELLGDPRGCARGFGGSASIQSEKAGIWGHDGLMGSHGPIATGMCFANRKLTLCFTGDAAAEEDYFLTSIGWAATKQIPIMFIIEDNDLSILTEKKVRRNWEVFDVAKSMGLQSYSVSDAPKDIFGVLSSIDLNKPSLINVQTTRLWWHAGAGVDNEDAFDRLKTMFEESVFQRELKSQYELIKSVWDECERELR